MSQNFTTRPEILGTFGVVTSTHWLATAVGMGILERNGNAFDAAIAAGFVLQVVEPHLNGPGGEVPILAWRAGEAEPHVICGQGVAPQAATIKRFEALGMKLVPGTGLLPAVVPGAFDAWMLLLRDFGTFSLEDILAPAISYAERGFPIATRAVQSIYAARDLFLNHWPSSAEVWLPHGRWPAPNSLHATPAIAATYRRIIAEAKAAGADRVSQIEAARRAFYNGFVAEAVDRFYRNELTDSSGRRNIGLLAGSDMAAWRATVEHPLSYDYRGLRVYKTGTWGQGPVFLQQLALLSGFDLEGMEPNGPDFVHTIVESAKLCLADREVYYGDPNYADIPIKTLLSNAYNDRRRKQIGETASQEFRPGDLPAGRGRFERIAERAGCETPVGLGHGEPTFADLPEVEGDTVHLDVIDRFGNAVSATPSGGWLQSSPVVSGLGFPLNTRGQMFWLLDGLPSSLSPGRRPRTTLTPTLVGRDGAPYMAFGTPGGDQQDQWTLTFFLRHILHGLNLQESIDAPMFNTKHYVTSFYPRSIQLGGLLMESRFPATTVEALRRRGHRVTLEGDWSLGRICAASITGGLLRAAATPRFMQGYASGR